MTVIGRLILNIEMSEAGHDVDLTVKQHFKVVARLVHGDTATAKAIFDKAQAKKDAREAVYSAVQKLERNDEIYRSADLDFLGSILKTVAEDHKTGSMIAIFAGRSSIGPGRSRLAMGPANSPFS